MKPATQNQLQQTQFGTYSEGVYKNAELDKINESIHPSSEYVAHIRLLSPKPPDHGVQYMLGYILRNQQWM